MGPTLANIPFLPFPSVKLRCRSGTAGSSAQPRRPYLAAECRLGAPPLRCPDARAGNNAFDELIQLQYTGSIVEYWDEFLRLLDRCDGVTQPQQVAFFTAGRCDPLRAVRTSSSSSSSAPNRAQIGRPRNRLSTAGKTTG